MQDFSEFVAAVTGKTKLLVDQLVPSPSVPVCMLERSEFRQSHKGEAWSEKYAVERYEIVGERAFALLETDYVNSVRVSLKFSQEEDLVAKKFYRHMSRVLPLLRREPVKGFDVSFLFEAADGEFAATFLTLILPVWQDLLRLLRLRQRIGHRQAGGSLFGRIELALDRKREEISLERMDDFIEYTELRSDVTEGESVGDLADLLDDDLANEVSFVFSEG